MTKSKAGYYFNTNLLKASSSSNSLQETKNEWVNVYQEMRPKKDGLCICQRNGLKYVNYFYNSKTNSTIYVGSACCKKFDFNPDKIKNKTLEEILKNNIMKGEYQVIDNIIVYTNSVETQLIGHFEKYTLLKNISRLKQVTEEIENLINDYKLDYLHIIYNTLTNLIKVIEKEEEEEEKLKIYCVEIHNVNYHPWQGHERDVYTHKFSSIEECEDFISKLQIGITKFSTYRQENTITCVKIVLNNEIIKTFHEKPIEIIKTFHEKPIEVKQTDYEERINEDGVTYWYHRDKHISLYKNPNIKK